MQTFIKAFVLQILQQWRNAKENLTFLHSVYCPEKQDSQWIVSAQKMGLSNPTIPQFLEIKITFSLLTQVDAVTTTNLPKTELNFQNFSSTLNV